MATLPSTSGIITNKESGERHIPESTRADGSTRRAIKIRPGYRPPEDVELYKNPTSQAYRGQATEISVPGIHSNVTTSNQHGERFIVLESPTLSSKNAKRREARKRARAKVEETVYNEEEVTKHEPLDLHVGGQDTVVIPELVLANDVLEVERERRMRGLRKKLRQAQELKVRCDGGEVLLPEQMAKVIKITELTRQIESLELGLDSVTEHDETALNL